MMMIRVLLLILVILFSEMYENIEAVPTESIDSKSRITSAISPNSPSLEDNRGNLVLDLDFMGADATYVYDQSGNDAKFTYDGNAKVISDDDGNGYTRVLTLDGDGDAIEAAVTTNTAVSNKTSHSFEFLFHPDNQVQSGVRLIRINPTGTTRVSLINESANTWQIQYIVDYNTTDASFVTTTLPVTEGIWYHLVCTHNDDGNKKSRIYLNGVEIVVSDTAGSSTLVDDTSRTFYIGSENGLTNEFTGEMALVRMYNRALTADEARSRYFQVQKKYRVFDFTDDKE